MANLIVKLPHLSETQGLADTFVKDYLPILSTQPLVIGIDGPLGSGKTTLVKAIGHSLQIKTTISSPTYTYLEEYPFTYLGLDSMLYHLDAWRITELEVFTQLAIDQLIQPTNLVIIEWFAQIVDWLKPTLRQQQAQLLTINLAEHHGSRSASISSHSFYHP